MLYLSCNEDELSLWFGDLWAGDMHLKSYKCYSVLFDRRFKSSIELVLFVLLCIVFK
jgi:hypothetical protein